MRTEFGQTLARAVEAKIEEEAKTLINGRSTTFEDYRARCGRIRGMRDVLDIVEDIERRMLGEEEKR